MVQAVARSHPPRTRPAAPHSATYRFVQQLAREPPWTRRLSGYRYQTSIHQQAADRSMETVRARRGQKTVYTGSFSTFAGTIGSHRASRGTVRKRAYGTPEGTYEDESSNLGQGRPLLEQEMPPTPSFDVPTVELDTALSLVNEQRETETCPALIRHASTAGGQVEGNERAG